MTQTDRYAVFVDVGYLAAAGQWAVTGQWRPRNSFSMDGAEAVRAIKKEAARQMSGLRLLRMYWYDATPGRIPTAEQQTVAELDDVTVRLGTLSSRGAQKGVDSLIVLDIYDAALAGYLAECVLLAGDADLVEGVTRSQARGLKVHVWSFETEMSTTSPELRAVADRHRYLDPALFKPVFTVLPEERQQEFERPSLSTFPAGEQLVATAKKAAMEVAREVVETEPYRRLAEIVSSAPFVPSDIDGRLIRRVLGALRLNSSSDVLPREVVSAMREAFISEVSAGALSLSTSKGSNGRSDRVLAAF